MREGSTIAAPGIDRTAILPPIDFSHLRRLTDDTGILQHATYSVPNREHGYCVDDNARALIVACEADMMGIGEDLRELATIYLSFILHALNRENGRFRNFMSFDRRWLEEAGSEDSHGRTLWALGAATAAAPIASQRTLAASLMEEALPAVDALGSPRSLAFTILGIDRFLDHRPHDGAATERMEALARRIHDAFLCNSGGGWVWCEDIVTYSNAILPLALLIAGARLGDRSMSDTALDALGWLIDVQTARDGHLSIVGNDGWLHRGRERAPFDQQPLDAAALLLACERAHRVTGDSAWRDRAGLSIGWFLGWNDLGVPLYDPATGGCCDGLGRHGPNANQGAESTVVWLLARLAAERVFGSHERGRSMTRSMKGVSAPPTLHRRNGR